MLCCRAHLVVGCVLGQGCAEPVPRSCRVNVVAEEAFEEEGPRGRNHKAKQLDLRCCPRNTKVQKDLGWHGHMALQVGGLDLGVGNHLADVAHAALALTPCSATSLNETQVEVSP